ncbi:innexin family protein [Aphelenchoides avenae]|nr:innexin family protein [Aphelenchus avenae]
MLPMIGYEYISKLGNSLGGKLKNLAKPLLKDGIGDTMDKGNLWIVPGFTILAFSVLWATKLSKIALEDSTCKGASIYDLTGTELEEDAQKHCATARRYFVGINEPFSYEQSWREERQVKNPEWVLWFWAPIVFVMYVLTRFIWTLLLENQGVNFNNVVKASQSVLVENDGVREVDEERLYERVPVIADNFRTATSSHAVAAFITFEACLVLAPVFLLVVVLPLMIGSGYRTWGFDIARAWWEHREWKGEPIRPLFGSHSGPVVPLIPRVTYCDYHWITLSNDHVLTYRCYLDANWHERTALFTWGMLLFLFFVNFCNLVFWVLWAMKMTSRKRRKHYVLKKWLNHDDIDPNAYGWAEEFADCFRMSNLLLFYFIEAHTDRVVASAFCTALFNRWLQQQTTPRRECFSIPMPKDDPNKEEQIGNVGWNVPSPGVADASTLPLESPSTVSTGTSSSSANEGDETQLLPQSPPRHMSTPKSSKMQMRRPYGYPRPHDKSGRSSGFFSQNLTAASPGGGELDPLDTPRGPAGGKSSRWPSRRKDKPQQRSMLREEERSSPDDDRPVQDRNSRYKWKCAVM